MFCFVFIGENCCKSDTSVWQRLGLKLFSEKLVSLERIPFFSRIRNYLTKNENFHRVERVTRLKSSNFSKEYFQIPTILQDKETTGKNNRTKLKYPRRRSVNLDNIQQLEHNVTITSISIRKPEENCPKEKVYDYSYDQIMISRSNNDPPLRRIRRNMSVLR